ncbi:hypothetical protein Chor_013374 [Crotalus horridus]
MSFIKTICHTVRAEELHSIKGELSQIKAQRASLDRAGTKDSKRKLFASVDASYPAAEPIRMKDSAEQEGHSPQQDVDSAEESTDTEEAAAAKPSSKKETKMKTNLLNSVLLQRSWPQPTQVPNILKGNYIKVVHSWFKKVHEPGQGINSAELMVGLKRKIAHRVALLTCLQKVHCSTSEGKTSKDS